jgi:hypothetical protein
MLSLPSVRGTREAGKRGVEDKGSVRVHVCVCEGVCVCVCVCVCVWMGGVFLCF